MTQEKTYLWVVGVLIVLVGGIIAFSLYNGNETVVVDNGEEGVKQFETLDEMKVFIKENSESDNLFFDLIGGVARGTFGVATLNSAPESVSDSSAGFGSGESKSASDYSTTNVQVEGVDEPDFVKNDGKYIYKASGNMVSIINAYPAEELELISEINVSGSVNDLFINGDHLVLISQGYRGYESSDGFEVAEKVVDAVGSFIAPYYDYGSPSTIVLVYDVSDRENPELVNNVSVDGSYLSARMIEDYVYFISQKSIRNNNPVLPMPFVDGVVREFSLDDVYYFDYPERSYVFNTISALRLSDGEYNGEVYLTGYSGTIYSSQDNLYLTYTKWSNPEDYTEELVEVYYRIVPRDIANEIEEVMDSSRSLRDRYYEVQEIVVEYSNSLKGDDKAEFDSEFKEALDGFEHRMMKEREKTIIHKISLEGLDVNYESQGSAPGTILNQFSMDEYDGNFRIATTTGDLWSGTSLNHMYVLNEDLEIIGSVEDLAPGERIYSARFMGDRAYMVTFKKIDPFYVIDLSDPAEPEVLGYLKIPGFSDYLHPYDENHIIGIGKDTVEASDEELGFRGRDFAWYQGLKISLFDVSDVSNPKEKAKIIIGDRGTSSDALYDHRAFLFDKERGIIVIPVELHEISEKDKLKEVSNTYGERVWSGAYVLNIDEEEISVRGRITHFELDSKYGPASDEEIGSEREDESGNVWSKVGNNAWKVIEYRYDWMEDQYEGILWEDIKIDRLPGGVDAPLPYDYGSNIRRSLYMDDILYTISEGKIKANEILDLDEISTLELPYEHENYWAYY